MDKLEESRTAIREAFKGSTPPQLSLRAAMHKDIDYRDKPYNEKAEHILPHWWDLADSELRDCVSGLTHLDLDGFPFYLPAYLDLALREPTNRALTAVWFLVRKPLLTHHYSAALLERWENKIALLTERQLKAVRNALDLIAANNRYLAFATDIYELQKDRAWPG